MSTEFDPELKGSIFKNRDKIKLAETRDTTNWAEYQGKIQVAGVEFYASMFVNKIKKGEMAGQTFFGVSLKPVDEDAYNALMSGKGNNQQVNKSKVDIQDFGDDDDLPF